MNNQRKYDPITIGGVVACFAAFLLIIWYNTTKTSPVAPQPPPVVISSPAADENRVSAEQIPQEAKNLPLLNSIQPATAGVPGPYDPLQAAPLPQQEPFLLEIAGELEASLDPAGGGITSVLLEKHFLHKGRDEQDNGKKVVLGHYDYPFLALNSSAAGWNLLPGEAVRESDSSVRLARASSDGNFLVTEIWRPVAGSEYEFSYQVTVKNQTQAALSVSQLRLESGALPASLSDKRKASIGEAYGGVSYANPVTGKVETLNMKAVSKKMTLDKQAALAVTPASWLAVHSKYFLFYVRLNNGDSFSGLEANAVPGMLDGLVSSNEQSRMHARGILPSVSLAAEQEVTWQFTAYCGAKDIRRLHDIGGNLDNIMAMDRFFFWNFSWMGWLSRILLAGMVWISQLFPPSIGYGMGIVGVTLVVKLLFWPLNHRSTVSMRKMSALNPELKKLREKYKEDPQKMYRKQQELFKANKVSQLGGCLPMFCQIPVFFALFNTFRNAIELRHAGFLWAVDLSMPDDLFFSLFGLPIRPLALLMGATMYLQQKLTPSPDPNQAKMMNMMSLVFIFMFYGMPSALTLYMTVNQLLSIVQMLVIRRLEDKKGQSGNAIVIP